MPEFPKLPIITPPSPPQFPELPILEPDPPRMSLREKYGGLYYLGIGGLIVATYLLGSFGYGLYRTRHLWAAVFVVSNEAMGDPARFEAAWAIAHDPEANDLLRMNLALQKSLPPLARYLIAEGLTSESIRADPKGYAEIVARSDGWPDWLRLVIARPMAYAVGAGYRIPWEPLDELRKRSDRAIVLWMTYTRAVMGAGDATALQQLRSAATQPGPYQALAKLLDEAAQASGADRLAKLDQATVWIRQNHPPCVQLWDGWEERNGELVSKPREVKESPARPPSSAGVDTAQPGR